MVAQSLPKISDLLGSRNQGFYQNIFHQIVHFVEDTRTSRRLPQRTSKKKTFIHPLNSYLPFLSTASNSILANSAPVELSSNLQSTLSPGFTGPTPDGVPVRITSPVWKNRNIYNDETGRNGRNECIEGSLHPRKLYRTETELTSRLIIDDTCSIKTGILKIISEVGPFCFSWPFT